MILSRWVVWDFKDPEEKDREDLFSATPPLEMMRFIMSRQERWQRKEKHFFDMKKAHAIPLCEKRKWKMTSAAS